jgi:hypothetical protein
VETSRTNMKQWFFLCVFIVILAALFCGCTCKPAAPHASKTPVAVTQQPAAAPIATGPAFVGTNWQLSGFDDTKGKGSRIAEGSTITTGFSADGKVAGFSGCSDYVTDHQLTETPEVWFR